MRASVGVQLWPKSVDPIAAKLYQSEETTLVMNELSVLAGDVERLGNQIRDVPHNQHVGIELRWIDLLRQICEGINFSTNLLDMEA
jgi:hypothetical protein